MALGCVSVGCVSALAVKSLTVSYNLTEADMWTLKHLLSKMESQLNCVQEEIYGHNQGDALRLMDGSEIAAVSHKPNDGGGGLNLTCSALQLVGFSAPDWADVL